MEGRGPMWRVTMEPYFLRRLRSIGSISKKDLRSHKKLPMIGKVEGPGGRVWVSFLGGEKRLKKALRIREMETAMRRMKNQVSIWV